MYNLRFTINYEAVGGTPMYQLGKKKKVISCGLPFKSLSEVPFPIIISSMNLYVAGVRKKECHVSYHNL